MRFITGLDAEAVIKHASVFVVMGLLRSKPGNDSNQDKFEAKYFEKGSLTIQVACQVHSVQFPIMVKKDTIAIFLLHQ